MSKKFIQFFLNHFRSINSPLSAVYISHQITIIKNAQPTFKKEPP